MGIQVCTNEGPCPFPREDNKEIAKIHWQTLKIFLRTTGPISTKLGTKHPWVMGIQVYSNEWPCPFPRGDNKEIAKIHWQTLKIFFLRTTGPISTKLGTKHSWVMGIQVCSNGRPRPFPRGDKVKIHWESQGQFQPNLAESIIGWRGFKFIQMKGHALFQGEIITR